MRRRSSRLCWTGSWLPGFETCRPPCRLVVHRLANNQTLTFSFAQVGTSQIRAVQSRPKKLPATNRRATQVRSTEIARAEIGSGQVGFTQSRAHGPCRPQNGAGKRCPRKIGTSQIRIAEIEPAQIQAGQVERPQVSAVQADGTPGADHAFQHLPSDCLHGSSSLTASGDRPRLEPQPQADRTQG